MIVKVSYFGFGKTAKKRSVDIVIGRKYVVSPMGRSVKNLGRICILLGRDMRDNSMSSNHLSDMVKVRYCDNNRVGYQEPKDLVEFKEV